MSRSWERGVRDLSQRIKLATKLDVSQEVNALWKFIDQVQQKRHHATLRVIADDCGGKKLEELPVVVSAIIDQPLDKKCPSLTPYRELTSETERGDRVFQQLDKVFEVFVMQLYQHYQEFMKKALAVPRKDSEWKAEREYMAGMTDKFMEGLNALKGQLVSVKAEMDAIEGLQEMEPELFRRVDQGIIVFNSWLKTVGGLSDSFHGRQQQYGRY